MALFLFASLIREYEWMNEIRFIIAFYAGYDYCYSRRVIPTIFLAHFECWVYFARIY